MPAGSVLPGPSPAVDLAARLNEELDRLLVDDDARRDRRYPGDPTDRQPVHTVYVPADRFDPDTPARWGAAAGELLDRFAPDPTALAAATGLPRDVVAEVYPRVLAKLAEEPVEDLRVDFEDGFGPRSAAEEDEEATRAVVSLRRLTGHGRRPPFLGIRFKSLEGPTRHRGIRSLTAVVAGLADPSDDSTAPRDQAARFDGFLLTLPKVTSVEQVRAMVHACDRLERGAGLPAGTLRFEIQVETAQAVLGPDGTATVAPMVHAAEGRCWGLHYGTFDYSAGLGIAAAYQTLEHPAADHAKEVMQVAAAQTGVRLSDGSTNVVAFGDADQARETWTLHVRLVTRALQRGYYQGWDMHPGHLPSRYLATYAFHRAAMAPAAERLRRYVDPPAGGFGAARVLDEPATARALATGLLRGIRCGALDEAEVGEASGLDLAGLLDLTGGSHPAVPGGWP